jgi:hypothetical protein
MPLPTRYLKQPMRGVIPGSGCQRQPIHDGICKLRLSVSSHSLNRVARRIHELCFDPKHKGSGCERSGVYAMHSSCFSV